MKTFIQIRHLRIGVALFGAICLSAQAAGPLVNGGFESGFTGWTRVDQVGGDGTFNLQSGVVSPVNGFAVQPPPEGLWAAMTDAAGPGTHVLYQDFVVPVSTTYAVAFSTYINNQAGVFFTPSTLDFSTPALNQRARVDIMTSTSDPFSLLSGDVLMNLFETAPGDPAVSGYTNHQVDVTSLFLANQGNTLRFRVTEVDNVFFLNAAVDNVIVRAGTVPDTGPTFALWGAIASMLAIAAHRRRVTCP